MTSPLLFFLFLALAFSLDQFDSSVKVTYSSLIKLINPSSRMIVHSHEVMFGRGGVFSVSGYHIDDLGNYWQIGEAHKEKSKTYDQAVQCGDTITLSSAIIGYYLRVEETQFGLTTQLIPMVHGMSAQNIDQKINFQLQCVSKSQGQDLHFDDQIRLKHQVTGKYASLDPSYPYTESNCGRGCSIAGQIQLHAIDTNDQSTTVFQVKTGITFDQDFVGKEEKK